MKIWKLDEAGLKKFQVLGTDDIELGDMSRYSNPYDVWAKKVDQLMHQCFTRKTVTLGQRKPKNGEGKAKVVREIERSSQTR